METKLEKEMMIGPSMTDVTGKLGIAACFDLFMDLATEHAEVLGVGLSTLGPKGQFWLTVKSKVHFYRRPSLIERVQVSTWAESSGHVRCIRNYRMAKGSELLAEGRTQWAVMDMKQGAVVDITELYPEAWNVKDDTFRLEKFTKFHAAFGSEPFAAYTVASTDIDIGRHMNNVAYIRALQSTFSTAEWQQLDPVELEIQFLKQCREGEALEFRKTTDGNTLYVQGSVGDRVAVLIRIVTASCGGTAEA